MPLATKNNALIVKDGKVAESCACCGGWWCYDARGCCLRGCEESFECEQDCVSSGGVFLGAGTVCNFGAIVYPVSVTAVLAGSLPVVEACSPTIVRSPPFGAVTSNKDTLFGTQWAGTYSLSRQSAETGIVYRRSGSLSTGDPQITVTLRCERDLQTKQTVFYCTSIVAAVISPTQFGNQGDGLRQYVSASVASVGGNSRDGFSVPGNTATLTYNPMARTPPTFCSPPAPTSLSGVKILGLSVG